TPDADAATLATLSEGRTIGCFQIETPALRSTLKKLPIRGISDVLAALAIVRPGPASGEAKADFIRRANELEPALPPHPRLSDLLRATYGMMLYEEDLMAAIALMTGWSLSRADEFRAALLASADQLETVARLEQEFVEAGVETGITRREAGAIWAILVRFVA